MDVSCGGCVGKVVKVDTFIVENGEGFHRRYHILFLRNIRVTETYGPMPERALKLRPVSDIAWSMIADREIFGEVHPSLPTLIAFST